jgi:hypothetical protein
MRALTAVVRVGVLWVMLSGAVVHAAEYYVAPDGDDAAAGSIDKPFASVERAQQAAAAGDTVWIRGGEYHFSGTSRTVGVSFTKSGTQDKPIRYFAYQNEVPIFDLFELKPQERVTGLDVRCNAIHLRGLEVRGVRQQIVGDSWSVRIRGDHNVLERLHVHDGQAPGIFIASGASNLILNCDSHHNYDPLEDGGNGDGFGCHSPGGQNVLRGCRAWSNSDDGFDFINAAGTCTVERSWSFRNGYVPDTNTASGNGAGFKSGGFGSPPNLPSTGVPRHVVRFNLAFRNRSQGFYANHHPGGLDFLNNTAFANGINFDMLVEGGTSTHVLHNNVALTPGGSVMRFTGGDDSSNSWNLPVMVMANDFTGMDEMEALAPRQPDGSLPEIRFMHLAEGSDLIARGMKLDQPFAGNAPDLGAFERGLSPATERADAGVPTLPSSMDAAMGAAGTTGSMNPPPSDAGNNTPISGASGQPSRGGAGAQPVMPVSGSGDTAAGATSIAGSGNATAGSAAPSGTPTPAADGCSFRLTPGQRQTPLALWLLPLAAWLVRRRRRTQYSVGVTKAYGQDVVE